jgi:phenylalanyl-tRNA synthetase beta chain
MKVSLNWLRELVELPPTVDELGTLLTMAGVEVEGIATIGCAIPNVIVAEIKSSEQHPNADRLSVCQVDDGSGVARQIVCGCEELQSRRQGAARVARRAARVRFLSSRSESCAASNRKA